MTRKISFSDFINDEPVVNEYVVPAHVVDSPEDEEELEKHIPAIFATIHFKSDARPDGYTHEDIEEMNRLANQHLTK